MKILLKLSHGVAAIGDERLPAGSLAFLATSAIPTDGDAVSHHKSEQIRSIWPRAFRRFPRDGRPPHSCRQSPRTTLLCEPLERSHRQFQRSSDHRATAALPNPDPSPRTTNRFPSPDPLVYNQLLALSTTCQDSEVGKSVGKFPPKFTSFRRCFRCLGLATKAQHSGSRVGLFDTVVSYFYPLQSKGVWANLRNCRASPASKSSDSREIPDRREHGLQRRISSMGAPAADRRLITVRTPDPISSRGIEEALHSTAHWPSRARCERTGDVLREIRLRSGYITLIFKAIRRTPNRLIGRERPTNTTRLLISSFTGIGRSRKPGILRALTRRGLPWRIRKRFVSRSRFNLCLLLS
jgi:hypothetical protein